MPTCIAQCEQTQKYEYSYRNVKNSHLRFCFEGKDFLIDKSVITQEEVQCIHTQFKGVVFEQLRWLSSHPYLAKSFQDIVKVREILDSKADLSEVQFKLISGDISAQVSFQGVSGYYTLDRLVSAQLWMYFHGELYHHGHEVSRIR